MMRKAVVEQKRLARMNKKPKKLASAGKELSDCPLLHVGGGGFS